MFSYTNVYYKLTPSFACKYWFLWWSSMGLIGFTTTLIILYWFQEYFPIVGILSFWLLFTLFPVINFIIERLFFDIRESLPIIYKDDRKFIRWFDYTTNRYFNVGNNPLAWISIIVVASICTCTVLYIGLPFSNIIVQGLSLVVLICTTMCAGQVASLVAISLYILFIMNKYDVNPLYFSSVNNSPFYYLYSVYQTFTFIIIIGYGITVLSIWQSPYGFNNVLIWFLAGNSFFPLILLISSFVLISRLQKKVYRCFMLRINRFIELSISDFEKDRSKDNLEKLNSILDTENKLRSARLIPIDIEGFLLFVVSIIIPIAQFVLANI